MATPPENTVVNNPQAGRFEVKKDGILAVLEYRLAERKIVLIHTEVPEALSGQGIGSQLARAGLDYARAQGLKVVPVCPFVAGYIQKHPEYQDLVK
jgi:uncharacterized protein